MWTARKRSLALIAVASAMLVPPRAAPGRAAQDDRIGQIIRNVRANEELYRNIEIESILKYKLGAPLVVERTGKAGWIKSFTVHRRIVLQGDLVFVKMDESRRMLNHSENEKRVVFMQGYDGQEARIVDQGVANIRRERSDSCSIYRLGFPHTWPLQGEKMCFPLSVWLEGGKALQSHPQAFHHKQWLQTAKLVGEEEIDGLHCLRISVDQVYSSAGDKFVRHVWLAPDRNYLPIRTEYFRLNLSKTLPAEVCRTTEFKEIAPGVWLPWSFSLVGYDIDVLEQNKHVISHEDETIVEKAGLDPRYEKSFFTVEIPKGTLVHHVEGEKITKTYMYGVADSNSGVWRNWWFLLGVVLAVLVGAMLAYRWCRSRKLIIERSD